MARHNEIVTSFKGLNGCYDNDNADHRLLMMMIFLKVSDISNEARPMDVSEPWVECLLQEFFMQVIFFGFILVQFLFLSTLSQIIPLSL